MVGLIISKIEIKYFDFLTYIAKNGRNIYQNYFLIYKSISLSHKKVDLEEYLIIDIYMIRYTFFFYVFSYMH